ncbi:GIY-YIG nuclease family protein [Patescibacteria group bacterium]|nr:GIY-YIG nuclease family protein [Patescibacteria group bacterium]MBU4115986.1 GIY-YIG nuclease family protein [Patescibacteria group bacterium]
MFYIYILKSVKNGKYYIGATNSIISRINYHNSGKVKSTKNSRPWTLMHIEKYDTLSEARKRESQIKKWKSRSAIEKLLALSSNG